MKLYFGPVVLLFVVSTIGCFNKPNPSAQSGSSATSASSGVTAEEATPRETIGKTTQNVLSLDQALADGGVIASTKVEATNPLTQSADVYRTQVAKIGGMGVEHAIQLRNASSISDPKPLTHAQFMQEIIQPGQPNGIQLPMLPYYQEYAWDEKAQKLIAVDFPARQAEREKQRDAN
jgi:hypothetical protein